MRHWQRLFALWIVLLLAACGGGIPNVTPTVAPTRTPQETQVADLPTATPIIRFSATPTLTPRLTNTSAASPTASVTVTNSPTATFTATASITPSPTNTPTGTLTPSTTPTPTFTPSLTATPSPTATFTASATPSPTLEPSDTPTPSVTPLIFSVTNTAIPTATFTATLTALPTMTFTPLPPSATSTVTPNLEATQNAELLQTRAARPTFTPLPQATATNTIAPTLDVTPTFVTALPNSTPLTGTLPPPVTSTPQFVPAAPTATAILASPTALAENPIQPTLGVTGRDPLTVFSFTNTNTSAYSFNVGSGNFIFNGQAISGSVALFAVNPVDSRSYVRTNNQGLPVFVPIGGGESIIVSNPYFDNFYNGVTTAQSNKNFITDIAWATNGRAFSFVVQPPAGTDNINAGVYFWSQDYGRAFPLLRDCPNDGYSSCGLVQNRPAAHWQSRDVEWSPDSSRALITLWLPDEGRQALTIANALPTEDIVNAPAFLRFSNGQWLDNQRLLVSGLPEDRSRSIIGIWNIPDNRYESTLFDAAGTGLTIEDAAQRSDGQLIAVGRNGNSVRLYRIANGAASPLSGEIGSGGTQRIEWGSNYGLVVVTVNNVQYSVSTSNGAIQQLNVNGAVNVGGTSSNSTGSSGNSGTGAGASSGNIAPIGQREATTVPSSSGNLPTTVLAGSRYSAGQQIQYIGDEVRNVRQTPDWRLENVVDILQPLENVTIVAGPYFIDDLEWWFVQTPRNIQGWTSTQTTDNTLRFFNP